MEVIFRELTRIYKKQETSVNYFLLCVQMFKKIAAVYYEPFFTGHYITSFKNYHRCSLRMNMDSLARIQFTDYPVLKKQSLYDRVYKRFISSYRHSASNLIEYPTPAIKSPNLLKI
ncbi:MULTISPECIES: DUF1548 domain-containing protein [Chlamydia]|uniref:DUF1548 domain-containing protein n=1 Tax=Chlamydia TaxID=810 RepID=UPI001F2FF31A|nr:MULTISPECIES: DUF1548 domain-containing protein [Chlamydia]UOB76515.1 DUF1548 domain-containing protein [Chlamydia psittaci]USB81810.1 DUF1548 domain-containing protein [Chlamydia psittaci]UWF55594.1 DUF1548 domain-containing protein [Chlamydia psittaci]